VCLVADPTLVVVPKETCATLTWKGLTCTSQVDLKEHSKQYGGGGGRRKLRKIRRKRVGD